ncbi:MAG: phenylalanine--tRNA ligase subunit beta [Saprospiraceae bacterium]
MRISYLWLQSIIGLDKTPDETSVILTSLGLEVEGMERVEPVKGGLQGVVVGQVLECVQHPNADRLKLTQVAIGEGEPLRIVCGAPNVAVGQKVLVATVGTTLYPSSGESLTIKKSKIRGEESCGMICAEDELGLGHSHDGILILDSSLKPGTSAGEALGLNSDIVFEIGLTPNRADATSHMGVARDIAAWYAVHEKRRLSIHSEVESLNNTSHELPIAIQVTRADLCPRYSGICLKHVKVGPSPEWLQQKLILMDQKPINNVVDVTNFILFHYGQPLHAFDLHKIKGQKINVDVVPEGTRFETLDHQEKKLLNTDLCICNGEGEPLCIAGVMGAADSGVNEQTTEIFLESAYFNASSVRKTSMRHILRSNAAKIFEKGADPSVTIKALEHAVMLLQEIAGAEISSATYDLYPEKIEKAEVSFHLKDISALTGIQFEEDTLKEILLGLDIELKDHRDGSFTVWVPTNKPDVRRPADVVEEICRVYGLEHIPVPEKIQISFPVPMSPGYYTRQKLSEALAARGFNEVMNLSLCSSQACLNSGVWTEKDLVYINNTSNVHLDVMTPSVCLGGLQTIALNSNRQQHDHALFEAGKDYLKSGDAFLEFEKMGIWMTGLRQAAEWRNSSPAPFDFFDVKSTLNGLMAFFGIAGWSISEIESGGLFDYGISWKKGQSTIARCGVVSSKICDVFDVKKVVYYAEIDLSIWGDALSGQKTLYQEVSKYQSSSRDIAVVVDAHLPYAEIERTVLRSAGKNLSRITLFDVYINKEHLGEGKKSMALSLQFDSTERSLSSNELDQSMQQVMQALEKGLGASIRR